MVQLLKNRPFDHVDALNWIIMRSESAEEKITRHSLKVLCETPIRVLHNNFSRLMNLLLKSTKNIK